MALRHTPSLSWPMPRSRHPKPGRRRALELLASCPDGCTEAIMLAHGFTTELLVRLVRDGLASVKAENMVAGSQRLEIARVKITAAGRKALAEQ
jgi:hypothetical protein